MTLSKLGQVKRTSLSAYQHVRHGTGIIAAGLKDDDEIVVPLECIEVEVDVSPERTTRGSFCTIRRRLPERPQELCFVADGPPEGAPARPARPSIRR